MQTIALDDLSNVTGGRGGQVQQQPQQQQAQPQDPSQAAPQQVSGGNFMQGLDQFLSFFQSDSFQQLLGGIRGIIGQFSAGSGAPQQ